MSEHDNTLPITPPQNHGPRPMTTAVDNRTVTVEPHSTTLIRYSRPLAVFHWVIAILVGIAYLTSEGGPRARLDPPILHFAFGLAVLSLTLPRLFLRLRGRIPPPPSTGPRLLTRFASTGHALLYAFLIAVPVTGWFTASRLGLKIELLHVQLPWLINPSDTEPRLIATVHQVGGNLLLIVAAIHASVALWHSFWLRDRALHRMWPFP